MKHYFKDVIFVSATPGDYELKKSDKMVEQIIRPTGLVDPVVEVHHALGKLIILLNEIKETTEKGLSYISYGIDQKIG